MKQVTLTKELKPKTEYLSEVKDGFYLRENHANMIWQGNKKLIVQSIRFDNVIGKQLYLISNNLAYGILQIKSISPITLEKFKELEDLHRITENEFEEFFKGKKLLFAYEFSFLHRFDAPMRVVIPDNPEGFIKQVEFLADDFQVPKFVEQMDNITIVENFVSVVGSSIEKVDFEKVEFLFKNNSKETDFVLDLLKKKTQQILGNQKELCFLNELSPDFFEAILPLYDLVLIKKQPKIKKMFDKIEPMKFFETNYQVQQFKDLDKILTHMFGG